MMYFTSRSFYFMMIKMDYIYILYGIMYLSQLSPSSGSFFRSHSDYQWLLTTNKRHLEAQKNGEFFNYAYTVNGFQCHSNHSPQLFELKKKKSNKKTSHVILNVFFVIFCSSCNAQYFLTTGYIYTRLTFVVSLVNNEFL